MSFRSLFSTVTAVLISTSLASAVSIAIVNPGFETDLQGVGGWSDNVPTGWNDPNGNSNDNFMENIAGFASEGSMHIGFERPGAITAGTRNYIYQDLGTAWAPNTKYTLTVGVGNRSGFGQGASVLALGSTSDAAGVFVSSTTVAENANANVNTFQDFSLIFTTGAVAPTGNIRIYGENVSAGSRTHFDNFRLDAAVVPEPGSLVAGLAGGLGLMIRRRRR